MHLVPCRRPAGALEPAPATSLRALADSEAWEGFWSVEDERFYTRCLVDGNERWYCIADIALERSARRRVASRVIPFPVAAEASPRMIVGRYRGQAMIVGTRRRRAPGAKR